MLDHEILGRPPAMRPIARDDEPYDREDESWKGEHFLKLVKSHHGGGQYAFGNRGERK